MLVICAPWAAPADPGVPGAGVAAAWTGSRSASSLRTAYHQN